MSLPFLKSDTRSWAQTQGLGLALVDGLIAVLMLVYTIVPPVDGTPRALDATLTGVLALLAVLSLLVIPRVGVWGVDALLAATWLSVALVTATRPSAFGQIAFGTILLVVALYAAYFTSGVRFGLHLFGMSAAYLAARLVDPTISTGTYFGAFTIVVVVLVAVVIHHLKANDRRYRLLIDNTADVIFLISSGRLDWVSPSVERMLGWTPDELVGRPTTPLWHPEDRARALELREATQRGEPNSGLLRMQHKDGHYVWVEFLVKPLPHRESVGVWRDVSSRIQAEQAERRFERIQRETVVRKAEAAESRARLFQNISHELRTPLAIVQGPLYELQRHEDLSATERASIAAALRASSRMERLVDGLLDISRGHTAQLTPDPEPTDLAALTRGGVQMFDNLAAHRSLALAVSTDGVPPRVMIDPEAWMTILVNLVSNAIKYTSAGAVTVTLDYVDGTAHLSVADTGVGIPEDELPLVFERYQRSPGQPVHGPTGSGIGLAVVDQLITAAKGRRQISSRPGRGTTVDVWIPAPVCAPDAVSDSAHHLDVAVRQHAWAWMPPADGDAPILAPVVAQRGRILLVEDNDDLRRYLERLLTESGWDVCAVADAESALPHITTHDLLLADVMLPGQSGIDLVRSIREGADDSRWLPVVLLTARAGEDAVVEGLNAGADDYVTKPFKPAELLARIATHVELGFLRQIVLDQANDRAENLERALGSNRAIGTALGIIMATERLSADEAFSRLRTASQESNRKLRDVADEVIYTGAIP